MNTNRNDNNFNKSKGILISLVISLLIWILVFIYAVFS